MTLILWIQSHCETEKSFVKASKGKTLALPESHYFPIEYANWKTIHLWLRIFLSYSQRDSKAFFSWRKTLTHIPILHNDYFLDPFTSLPPHLKNIWPRPLCLYSNASQTIINTKIKPQSSKWFAFKRETGRLKVMRYRPLYLLSISLGAAGIHRQLWQGGEKTKGIE